MMMQKKTSQICFFLVVLLLDIKAFSPSRINPLSIHRDNTSSNGYTKDIKVFFASKSDEVEACNDVGVEHESSNKSNLQPTRQQRARILFYRAGLATSAVLLSIQALGDVSFFEGTGINIDGLFKIVEQSHSLLPVATGASLGRCPMSDQRTLQLGTSLVGVMSVVCGIASYVVPEQTIFTQSAWILSLISLLTISIREIDYFGFEYKQECGIILSMLPFMLNTTNQFAFATPLCALGLGVLAAGKLFEPLYEDLIRSKSEFLTK